MKKNIKLAAIFVAALAAVSAAYADGQASLFSYCGNQNYKSPKNVQVNQAENQSQNLKQNWWKESAFYHIWVKSFKDSNGDGCGDLNGITQELDYIKNTVGCDAIWLSPIFQCNIKSTDKFINMHGYDTTDYYSLNELFGTEADLEKLLSEAHKRGMKVIFDFVPNHTSPLNQWFIDSHNNANGKRDWYLWSSTAVSFGTNMNSSGWYHAKDGESDFFYGAFGPGMPDLNFRNYEVREEMKNVVRYWLNKGFDGLRVDAVRYLVETRESGMDTRETHRYFQELRQDVIDKYTSPKFMVCEDWIEGNMSVTDSYFGTDSSPEFNMVFDFNAGRPVYNSVQFRRDKTDDTIRSNPTADTCYGTFIGNHDLYESRLGSRLKNDQLKMKQATALSLLRPTVPFIYYGNELGQKNVDFGGDLKLRGDFQWDLERQEQAEPDSILNLNKALLTLRKTYAAEFADGKVSKLSCADSDSQLAYVIKSDQHSLLCVFNFAEDAVDQVVFTGLRAVRSASLLVGDTSSPDISFQRGKTIVSHLAPCSYRVYLLGENASCIWDDETYIAGQHYTPANDSTPIIIHADHMYLRGTMNGWGGIPMTLSIDKDGNHIWTVTVTLDPGKYEYKFCSTDTSVWGASFPNNNAQMNSDGGQYTFVFNETKQFFDTKKVK